MPSSYPAAQYLVDSLIKAGVPRETVFLAPPEDPFQSLAAGPVSFAAVDLTQQGTQALYRVLGVTKEDSGQTWLKALISMNEGPRPGETGFLRQFAYPKAITVQTLRHGADLELLQPG